MSKNITKSWQLTPTSTSKEIYEYIAQREAEIAAEVAAEAAAKRQAQKDLIKEAIIEALNGPEETKPGISEHPVKLRASTEALRAVMQMDEYRLNTNRKADIKVEFLKPVDKLRLLQQGYFARLWAALRGE